MEKNFNFKAAEAQINAKWENGEMFKVDAQSDKPPFTIIMPPPNVTSKLHMGHAFGLTIKDAIIRFKRMQGFNALLLPGADHAAIATEIKVIAELKNQGIERRDLTREQFLEHVQNWYQIYIGEITDQIKRLGISADWSRFAFTMDEQRKIAVRDAFLKLHERGLIYKGERMINWCPTCETAVSDIEVEHKPKQQVLYEIKFGDLVISTVRPEVIFADAAVAVHPRDKRYKNMVGGFVTIPLTDTKIPIIADDSVDMKFGTGVLQITPANSHVDYEIAIKHGLEIPKIPLRPRGEVVRELTDAGLIVGQKKHTSNVGTCYRCGTAVEPTLSKQWFVKMDDLAKRALENAPTILPKKFIKIYQHWLKNIKDWCISRQLTSGHPIPIDGETDVLDTWFSSALWPFSTIDELDFKTFYPTQLMVMGYDILFFWMVRMVVAGQELTGQLPFDTVLFHGLVRDKDGKKMSKSLGNGIDPIEIIDEYGADALRYSVLYGTKLDRDLKFSMDRVVLARNFINKIWNATKWLVASTRGRDDYQSPRQRLVVPTTLADKWMLTKLNTTVKSVTKKYEKYDFGVACVELQNFFWHDVCDVYLEEVKKQGSGYEVFELVLMKFLCMVHPIMPYVTHEIWQTRIGHPEDYSVALQSWPNEWKEMNFPKERKEFDAILAKRREVRAAADEIALRDKKIAHLRREIERGEGVLANENFVARAPEKLVTTERAKLDENKKELTKLLQS